MIGRFVLAGFEGKDLNLSDLTGRVVGVYDDYRGKIGRAMIHDLIKSEYNFILHDYMGVYSGVHEDIHRLFIGIDIQIPIFNYPEELDYPSIYGDILYAILVSQGFKEFRWRTVFARGLEEAIKRGEGNLASIINELNVIKNESTGVEKEAYTILLNILKCLFTESDIELLSRENYIEYKDLCNKKVVLDYTTIKSPLGRLYIQSLNNFLITLNIECFQVTPYSDYIYSARNVIKWIYPIKPSIYFIEYFNRDVFRFFDIIIMPTRDYTAIRRFIANPLYEGISSDYTYVDDYIATFLKVPEIRLIPTKKSPECIQLGEEYLIQYNDIIKKILSIVLENGRISIDGLYIQSGVDKGLLYSLVDRLWRDGYLKRIVDRGSIVYRISVKGMKFLKGVG